MKFTTTAMTILLGLSYGLQAQTMTVDQRDRVGIRNTAPDFTLHVKHANGTPAAENSNGLAIAHDSGPTWTMYVSNTNNELQFYRNGVPEVAFGPDGAINTLSDEKSKKNITQLPDGQLEKLLKLSPSTYQYKESPTGKRSTGFLAQELYTVFPAVVNYLPKNDDGAESWMVSYSSLVPYLVKGIQEQQSVIDSQREEIEALRKQQAEILSRLAKLEKE